MRRRRFPVSAVVLASLAASAQPLRPAQALAVSQSPAGARPQVRSTTTSAGARQIVVLGARYRASGLKRRIFGSDYRDLWTTPIEVEVLDLKTEAGGLTPVRQVGRNQTAGLALSGGDGKSYTFRGIDKDPTAVLPDELLGTPIADLAQDQISSNFPAADVAAGPIGRAAGLNGGCPTVR